MIYLSDDYVTKYSDVISYLLSRSYSEGYSFDFIQKNISYSKMMFELEKSNVTTIAFSSMEKIYYEIFPVRTNDFIFDEYGPFGWVGLMYVHLFLKKQLTLEAIFYVIPIEQMLHLYHLYHEMSLTEIDDYFDDVLKYSILDIVMKNQKISNTDLSKKTGISSATIKALRYGRRNLNKLESEKLLFIAQALNIKMETLLTSIHLQCA